jgi:hypothetical protein
MHCFHFLSGWKSRTRFVGMLVVLLLLMTSVWVLNLLHVVAGSWSTILSAIFTGLGSIASFLQLQAQVPSEASNDAQVSLFEKTGPQAPPIAGPPHKRKGGMWSTPLASGVERHCT